MGGGHSHNGSSQNSSIKFAPNVSGHGTVKVHDIRSGSNSSGQRASSTGAHVGVGVQANVMPLLQDLAELQDLHTFHLHIHLPGSSSLL